jgi:very-short-patch-repair endonuclease
LNLARKLRRSETDAEKLLWKHLRGRRLDGYKFRRQVSIGGYVADFAALEARLIIELDGGQHAERIAEDQMRTAELERFGFRVVRFWNHDVLANIDGVLEAVLQELRLVR